MHVHCIYSTEVNCSTWLVWSDWAALPLQSTHVERIIRIMRARIFQPHTSNCKARSCGALYYAGFPRILESPWKSLFYPVTVRVKRHLFKTLKKWNWNPVLPFVYLSHLAYLLTQAETKHQLTLIAKSNAVQKIRQRKGDLSWKQLTNSYTTGCYSSATVSNFKYREELAHVNSNSLRKKYKWLIV